jgi:hypothetical protein
MLNVIHKSGIMTCDWYVGVSACQCMVHIVHAVDIIFKPLISSATCIELITFYSCLEVGCFMFIVVGYKF